MKQEITTESLDAVFDRLETLHKILLGLESDLHEGTWYLDVSDPKQAKAEEQFETVLDLAHSMRQELFDIRMVLRYGLGLLGLLEQGSTETGQGAK